MHPAQREWILTTKVLPAVARRRPNRGPEWKWMCRARDYSAYALYTTTGSRRVAASQIRHPGGGREGLARGVFSHTA